MTGDKIADDAVDSEHYVDGSIDTAHLSDDCVSGAKIADDAIDSEHYADGSIDAAHISSGAVTETKLGTDAVTTTKIKDANVTKAKLSGDALDWVEIVTDQLLGSSGSISTTAHVGYSEMMLQVKSVAGDSSNARGVGIIPLKSTGEGNPSSISVIMADSDGGVHYRSMIITATQVVYSLTQASDTQYLSVFVR